MLLTSVSRDSGEKLSSRQSILLERESCALPACYRKCVFLRALYLDLDLYESQACFLRGAFLWPLLPEI